MARILNTKTQDIKSAIQLEGRPWANTIRNESDGIQLEWDSDDSVWQVPVSEQRTFSAGSIDIKAGRAIWIESIIISSDQAGFIEGFFRYNDGADWVGTEDVNVGGATDGTIRIATNGSPVTLNVNRLYSEFFNITITRFVPSPVHPSVTVGVEDFYVRPTPIEPNLAVTVLGMEITNDLNFGAAKRLGFAGDSLSWSLIGDYRTQDLGYNLTGSNDNFPPNFGNNLAAFRLVNALREGGEDIRLVNKGFGGSTLLKEQWYMLKTGAYTYPWNIFILQAGANDSSNVQTPLYQLTFKNRMRDFCSRRLEDGHTYQDAGVSKPYPMVFCTAPSLDDKSKGLNSRNNLDVRVPIDGESYDTEFSTTTGSGDTAIDFTTKTNRYYKVSGDNDIVLELSGGVDGEFYRVDFWDDSRIYTGTTGASYSFVHTLDSYNGTIASSGIVSIDAMTSIFFKAENNSNGVLEYKEVDRVKLVGRSMSDGDVLFDPVSPDTSLRQSHFIASRNTANSGRTKITAPAMNNISQRDTIGTVGIFAGYVRLNLANNTITSDDLPASSSIDTNDVWVRLYDMEDSAAGSTESWEDSNGFYKVIGYEETGGDLDSIDILFDARDGNGRDFSGTYTTNSGGVEIIKTRDYTPMFETGDVNASASNCFYFEAGDVSVGEYTYRWQLQNGATTFNLLRGKGIVFSCYQQGKTIFMNEIVSGDIVNTGDVKGAANATAFYADANEVGKTRMGIVNSNISSVVDEYSANDNVHLIDLNDYTDIKDVSETTGKRLYYNSTTEVNGSAYTWKVGDLIEDPTFKRVGDTGTNECVVGNRIHRSPKGHELMFDNMNSVVSNITIPS